ncbi:MAG: Tn7-like element transposition protein TnsE [Clostridia bacterium]|nr:Tn7-like element transposition protein TnsE [Clostridia bacterium]
MGRLRLRPWSFSNNEEVELYWHGAPFLNSDGLWMIKCLFKRPHGTFREHIFPFGTLPYLRIGQTYIDGDFAEKIAVGSLYEVKINDFTRFDICKGFDFPRRLYAFDRPPAPTYGNLLLCRFEVAGVIYYLPCTEIVRSILAPYKMFANQILRPEGLGCFIENSSGYKNKLELKLTEEYHRDLLKDEMIAYFVWLKFDKSAESSWNSVYKNIIFDASQRSGNDIKNELRKGIPIRVLPPVKGPSTWTFRGLAYKNHRLILEITYRSNLEIPFTEIELYHPKLEKLEADRQPRYAKDPTKRSIDNKDVELDSTGQGAESRQNQNVVEQPPVMFNFKRKPRIYKKRSKTRRVYTGDVIVIGTKQDDNKKSNVGTTQDWVQGGSIPQIEFSILKMVDASLSKGLEEFLRIVEYIQTHKKELSLSLSIIPLPQFKGFSRYEDGSIRTCAIVRVECQRRLPCYIIEVGRADGWSISTLIIKPVKSDNDDINMIEGLIERLLKDLVCNNGHWEREFFRNESAYVFDTAKHISDQPVIRWAERIVEKF